MTDRDQTRGEEITNSASHGFALGASLVGTPFLIINVMKHGDTGNIIGAGIFAASMVLLYLSSAIYHGLPHGRLKRTFRTIEHSAIYLLIAGTYTPFTLGILRGPMGWTLFGLIWGLALTGVALKYLARLSHPILSTALYLIMGWLIMIAIKPLVAQMPASGLFWLVGGGLAYSLGVIFYLLDNRIQYAHLVWHFFVMTGTVFHYFAVLWYAAG